MKKIFGFGGRKGVSPLGLSNRPGSSSPGDWRKGSNLVSSPHGYDIQHKDLGKIHKAATVGNVAKVKQILLLRINGVNDTDKMNRTALHLACANGHVAVVTLLADRKCLLNLSDSENRTALIKAVQCQQEECATILLDRGADPNIMDIDGNTALHHAVLGENTAIVAKLLAHKANIEARNKDDLTPLSLAMSETKEKMMEFLVNRGAKVDQLERTALMLAVNDEFTSIGSLFLQRGIHVSSQDDYGWTTEDNYQLTYEYKGERRPKMCSESSRIPVDIDLQESPKQVSRRTNSVTVVEKSEEDSLSRLSSKPDIDDSWPTSEDEDFDFDTKNVMKPSLTKLMTAIQQSHENTEAKYGIVRPENRTLREDSTFLSETEDITETFPKTSEKVQGFSQPAFPSLEPPLKASHMSLGAIGLLKEEATKPAIKIKGNSIDITESAAQNQTNNNNLTYVDGKYKNSSSDKMAALGLGEDEDEDGESLWDSEESFSGNLPQKYVDHLFEAVGSDKRSEVTVNGQVEDVFYVPSCMSGSRKFTMAKVEDTGNGGIPVAHIDSPGKYSHLKPAVEVQDPVPEKAAGTNSVQTSRRDLSAALDSEVTSEEEQERLNGSGNHHSWVEEKKIHNSGEVDAMENGHIADSDDSDGLIQQRKSEQTEKQPFPVIGNEYSDRSTEKTSYDEKTFNEENKVKEKFNSMDDLDDLTQSSETFSEHCQLPYSNCKNFMLLIEKLGMDCKDSISLLKIQDTLLSYERLIELKQNHCEILTGKIKDLENRISKLKKELSETKQMKSQLEHQKVEWEQELCNLRFTLKEEKEKRRNMDMLYDKMREQLRKKEEEYIKVAEMNQQLETTLGTLEVELKIVKKNLNQLVEERDDIQRRLSREQNARTSQDGVLSSHPFKQKETQIAHDKINSEVSDDYEKEKSLLHENRMLQDEIATIRLEIDTVKTQNQEMEKKYFEDIAVVKENNDLLQKTIKLNEEAFTRTVSQYNGQLNVLTAENTALKSKLETEKKNEERLETEIESYRSRLATAVQDHEQSETLKRDLQRDFQQARDEWFRLRDKMNCNMSELEDRNEILSQQLSKAESKFNSLEIELHHTRDALRERTLVLEGVQRDLSQTQCQKKELEHMYQKEQGKVNKYIGKQGSLEERLSQLQSENVLLRQQLDDAHNKADNKEKTVIDIQDRCQEIIKIFQAESEKQALMLNERNKELINDCNHLKERMNQYENDKTERDAMVRQLQQELADTLKKQSMSEASLEVTSRYRMDLEEETQDLKKKLHQIRSQLQEAQDRCAAAERCAEEKQDHVQKLEIEDANLKLTIKEQSLKIEQLQTVLVGANSSQDEREQLKKYIELKQSLEYNLDQEMKKNSELEKEITGFKKLLKITKRKLSEYENGEFSFPGDLKPNQIEVDIQINMLKQKNDDLTAKLEAASSKCERLDEKNKCLQQELLSMRALQKKCEKLKNEKKKWKQEGINLKTHMEMNMVEFSELEQYKRKIEERARHDIEEKLEEVNLFLQTQAASQENLEQLRENHNASVRSQLELRIQDLESELAKIKLSQNSKEINLEKYKQLYLEEIESKKSLTNILNKTNERLAELNTDLLLQKQQNRSLLSALHPKPGLEMPCAGDLNSRLVFCGNCTPRENLVAPISRPQTSSKSMETYLIKMRQEFEKTLTRELEEDAAEFEAKAYGACPVASADPAESCQDLIFRTSREYAQILRKNYMI